MDYQRDCLNLPNYLRQAIRNLLYYLDDEFRSLVEKFTSRQND